MLVLAEHDRGPTGIGDALGDGHRVVGVGEVLAQHDELVAAEAGNGVAGPQRSGQSRRQRNEELVAGLVAADVIDQLEVVEVHEQHRELGARAPGPGQRVLEAVQEQRPVGQPGERIVVGLVGERRPSSRS